MLIWVAVLFVWSGVVYTMIFDWDAYGLLMSVIGVILLVAAFWLRWRQ